MTDRLLPSVDILTPEFKARIDDLNEEYGYKEETLQLYVTPSSEDVTIEQMQEAVYGIMRDERAGILKSTPYWPDPTPKKTLAELLND